MNFPIFARTFNDGGVALKATADSEIVYFTASEWTEIIAHVSAYADDPAAVEFARLLHTGGLENVPPFRKRIPEE